MGLVFQIRGTNCHCNAGCTWPAQKLSNQGLGKNKLSNLWCFSPNPLPSSPLQTPHTCSSSPSIVRSTSGTDSLELPTAMLLHFILSPPCLTTYSTSTAFSSLRVEKGHMAQCPVNRGCSTCGIWSLAKTFWTSGQGVQCRCRSFHFHDAVPLHRTT